MGLSIAALTLYNENGCKRSVHVQVRELSKLTTNVAGQLKSDSESSELESLDASSLSLSSLSSLSLLLSSALLLSAVCASCPSLLLVSSLVGCT